ncbi:precorrin-4 C11-methyltransferase [Micromonospora sp. NPDC003197]
MHRSEAVTVGREGAGWLSLQLIIDRFRRREPWLKVDATRYGATQTVLLSATQAARMIEELTYGVEAIQMMSDGQRDQSGSTDG